MTNKQLTELLTEKENPLFYLEFIVVKLMFWIFSKDVQYWCMVQCSVFHDGSLYAHKQLNCWIFF